MFRSDDDDTIHKFVGVTYYFAQPTKSSFCFFLYMLTALICHLISLSVRFYSFVCTANVTRKQQATKPTAINIPIKLFRLC